MKCTSCRESLQPMELEPGLVAAECSCCAGLLLDLIPYRFWLERNSVEILESTDREVTANDGEGARFCPRCSRLMTKYQIGANSHNRLDFCMGCDSVWFDQGEWDLLKQLGMVCDLAMVFTDAWQRRIRDERQLQRVQLRYRQLLDTDFEQVESFRLWLEQHPQKEPILIYLREN